MANKTQFSIIIPVLNEEKYLPHLLDDLTKQTYKSFEVIVVDGKSDDQTVAKAKSFKTSLPSLMILTSHKRHVCVQRNLGAQHAKSDWLIFMDADNQLPIYFLQGIKYRLESQPCDVASTWISREKETPEYKIIESVINMFYETQVSLLKYPAFIESMIIVRRNFFSRIKGFNPKINIGEGRFFVKSISEIGGNIEIFKDPRYVYSLRRLNQYGTMRTIAGIAQNELLGIMGIKSPRKGFIQKLYPMLGGGIYSSKYKIKKNKASEFIQNISKLLKEL